MSGKPKDPGLAPMSDTALDKAGRSMISLIETLYPINRSITGEGLRTTLDILAEHIDLTNHEVATGTKVFDWEIPKEWIIREAYIRDERGVRVVNFDDHNLHVVGYSAPVSQKISLDDLQPHLHSLPEYPEWIPYRTSYYAENWGFCLAHNVRQSMQDNEYEVVIDSEFVEGSLTYGELLIEGSSDREFLIFAHCCHPSLCNDNLSGISLAVQLAKHLSRMSTRYSYRFIFAPATIGSITWLSRNVDNLHRIAGGLILSVIGDKGPLVYKKSRRGDTQIDRIATHVLDTDFPGSRADPFSPWGYDERQFCSPGIDLPMGRLTRTPHGEYKEYHTSADDLSVVRADSLKDSLKAVWGMIEVFEKDGTYVNLQPYGEPQLGRRGLYRKLGGYQDISTQQNAMLWVLNQSDGKHSLLEIADQARLPFNAVWQAALDLIAADLLTEYDEN